MEPSRALRFEETLSKLFNQQQKNQFDIWVLHAVVANDTDDSFVFSKAVGKIKDAISALLAATVDDDNDEAAALAAASKTDEVTDNKTVFFVLLFLVLDLLTELTDILYNYLSVFLEL